MAGEDSQPSDGKTISGEEEAFWNGWRVTNIGVAHMYGFCE